MKNRSIVLAMSVLCVGIMIMPYTVSLFDNQHVWVDRDNVDCMDCHSDLPTPAAGTMHFNLTDVAPQDYCKSCHQLDTGTGEGTTGNGLFDDEHAAATVECLDCHGDALGTGLGDDPQDVWWDSATDGALSNDPTKSYINIDTEAHTNMTGEGGDDEGAWASAYLAGNNEACISCHTGITVVADLTYYATTMYINATENAWGNWTVEFEPDGP